MNIKNYMKRILRGYRYFDKTLKFIYNKKSDNYYTAIIAYYLVEDESNGFKIMDFKFTGKTTTRNYKEWSEYLTNTGTPFFRDNYLEYINVKNGLNVTFKQFIGFKIAGK